MSVLFDDVAAVGGQSSSNVYQFKLMLTALLILALCTKKNFITQMKGGFDWRPGSLTLSI